jgi:hypothetical protein
MWRLVGQALTLKQLWMRQVGQTQHRYLLVPKLAVFANVERRIAGLPAGASYFIAFASIWLKLDG